MRTHLLAYLSLLVGAAAFSQSSDEWSSFPPAPAVVAPSPSPKAAPPKPVAPAVAQPAPSPAPSKQSAPPAATAKPPAANTARDAAKARVDERVKAADTQAAAVDELPVVSRKENYLPGTEPHSPPTWQNHFDDPTNARVTVGGVGIGLLHLQSARLGPQGVLRFSILGEYLSLGDFPVKGAGDIRSAGTFAASFQPFTWGEVFLGYAASANTNSRTSPNLIQALGDLTLGVKASREWVKGLWAGGDLRLLTFSGVGNQSIDRFAFGIQPRLLASYDVRTASPKVPLIAHLNLGFTFDNSSALLSTVTPKAAEEFALSLNRFNRFNFGLGVEAPLPWATPFIEYAFGLPMGAGALVGPDMLPVDLTAAMNQTLGLGVKVTAIKDLTFLLAFDVGLSRLVGLGVPATPPWNFLFGASFNIDPFQRGETKLVETVRERKVEKAQVPKTSKLEGTVVDAQTKKPIPGVIVAMVGAGLPPVASDAENGRFLTHELAGPEAKLKVSKDGYRELEKEFKLEPGKTQKVELTLEPQERKATFDVSVTTQGKKKAIAAVVTFRGPVSQSAGTTEGVKEPVKLEVPAGQYTVAVTSDGYLAQTREVQITTGATMAVEFDLNPAPKKMLVTIKDDKIEIQQQVHFATGKADILADSFQLLQQVVDVVVKNNVKRVRVEGHTDNRGDKAANQKLSQDRAAAVADFLVKQGIDKGRLESAGFGDSKPVAPNLTARGRELNRRVEFIILEK